MERKYQLECEVVKGSKKGERFLVGNEDCFMTHGEVIHFRDAHTKHNHIIYHIVERNTELKKGE